MKATVLRGHEVPDDVVQTLQTMLEGLNELDPPDHSVPWFLSVYRHPCTRARQSGESLRGVSTAIQLKEKRIETESGEYALLYREGVCHRCHQTARSKFGCAVQSELRPPLHGRVARG